MTKNEKAIAAECKRLGMKRVTLKFYDAPPATAYRVYDSVGATLYEVIPAWYRGSLKDIEKKAKSLQSKLVAKPASDAQIWKWLSRGLVLTKWDLENGRVTYSNKEFLLLYGTECWTPLIDGTESRDIAGSSAACLGEIGHTRQTFVKWLEAQGVVKAKPNERY